MVAGYGKRLFGLTSHVMAGALLIHVIVLPILYVNMSNTFKNSAEEQFIGNAREVSGLLGDMFSVANLVENKNSLASFMDYALLTGEILFIEIVDQQGNVIRSQEKTSITADDFIEDDYIGHHDDDVYFMSIPLNISFDGFQHSIPGFAAFGAQIDDPIGCFDNIHVVFDHQNRIAAVDQSL